MSFRTSPIMILMFGRQGVSKLMEHLKPSAIVHCAAQPSHDLSALRPLDDFDVNAGGTLNMLDATYRHCRESPFVHLSTNKLYGAAPNEIPVVESGTRWDYADAQ